MENETDLKTQATETVPLRSRWTWSRVVEALRSPDSEAALRAAKAFRRVLVKAYEELRAELEGVDSSVSWEDPFLTIPFLCSEDGCVASSGFFDTLPEEEKRELQFMFEVFTAGAGVEFSSDQAEECMPRPPESVWNCLSGIPERPLDRSWKKWFKKQEWAAPAYYGIAHLTNSEDRQILGYGKDGRFGAALYCEVSPRVYFSDSSASGYLLTIGLPWAVFDEAEPPQDWTGSERAALWETVSRFLETAAGSEHKDGLPRGITVEVSADSAESAQFTRFEASYVDAQGQSYWDQVRPRELKDTYLELLPQYALGSFGPELPVSDGQGGLDALAPLQLHSVMAFPNDPLARRQMIAKSQLFIVDTIGRGAVSEDLHPEAGCEEPVEESADYQELLEVARFDWGWFSPADFEVFRTAPSEDEVIKRARAHLLGGGIAGQMLLDLLHCAEYDPKHVSSKSARYLRRSINNRTAESGGEKKDLSDSSYRDYWIRYRPVAHLWAAHLLWREWNKPSETLFSEDPTDFKKFLSLAEALRKRGERVFARGQWAGYGPVLDPRTTWRAPEDLVLADFPLTVQPLPKESLKVLASYKPPKLH
jgi:hypothetical protein